MPKKVDAGKRRSEFVDATWRLIHSEGLSAATLRRVAIEAKCTTGALTHYFSNRDSLLVEALRSAHLQAATRMLEIARRAGKGRDRLEAIVLEALPLDSTRMREWRTRLAFWAAAADRNSLLQENARRFRDWTNFLEAELAPSVDGSKQLRQEVALLAALVDGLALRLLTQSPDMTIDAATRTEVVADVRHYLGALQTRCRKLTV